MNRHTVRKSVLPRAAMTGAGLIGLGWVMHLMPDATPGRVYWPWLLLTGVLLLCGVGLVWRNQRGGSAGLVNRWARRGRRNHGLASPWAILRVSSAFAMRRKAGVLRPSLRRLGRRRLFLSTGIRAVDHAVETLLASGSHPLQDTLALEALRRLRASLLATHADPTDLAARTESQLGAWFSFTLPGPAAAGLPIKPADLTEPHLFTHNVGDLYWWIGHGLGGVMPGFEGKLTPRDRWNVIQFIRAHAAGVLAKSVGPKVTSAPAPQVLDFAFEIRGAQDTPS